LEKEVLEKPSTKAMVRIATHYTNFCSAHNLLAWPPSYDSTAPYLVHQVDKNRGSAKSLDVTLSGIKVFSTLAGMPWLESSQSIKLRRLIQRLKFHDTAPINRKLPLTLDILYPIVSSMRIPNSITDLFIAAALMLAHDGLLRTAELLSLQVRHLSWSRSRRHLTISIDRSKCNQAGPPEVITLHDYGNYSGYRLVDSWIDKLGISNIPLAYIFPSSTNRYKRTTEYMVFVPLKHNTWRSIIKSVLRRNSIDATNYSGHSLRAGGATDLFRSKVPLAIISKMGRWASNEVLKYYRDEEDVGAACAEAFQQQLSPLITMGETEGGERLHLLSSNQVGCKPAAYLSEIRSRSPHHL
jgi:integrase